MIVYFLRHGVAFEAQEWSGTDFDRPLTDEGKKRMKREAKTLSKLTLGLDAIVTSPLVRAKQTAQIVAETLDAADRLFVDARLGTGFDVKALGGILADRAQATAVMLVGHEPSMSETIGVLVGGASVVLKKGGLAAVELHDETTLHGDLTMLLPPKTLLGRRAAS